MKLRTIISILVLVSYSAVFAVPHVDNVPSSNQLQEGHYFQKRDWLPKWLRSIFNVIGKEKKPKGPPNSSREEKSNGPQINNGNYQQQKGNGAEQATSYPTTMINPSQSQNVETTISSLDAENQPNFSVNNRKTSNRDQQTKSEEVIKYPTVQNINEELNNLEPNPQQPPKSPQQPNVENTLKGDPSNDQQPKEKEKEPATSKATKVGGDQMTNPIQSPKDEKSSSSLKEKAKNRRNFSVYVVGRDENWESIANKLSIKDYIDLVNQNAAAVYLKHYVNDLLKVPLLGTKPIIYQNELVWVEFFNGYDTIQYGWNAYPDKFNVYIVPKNVKLDEITKQFHFNVNRIAQGNNIKSRNDIVHANSLLKVPKPGGESVSGHTIFEETDTFSEAKCYYFDPMITNAEDSETNYVNDFPYFFDIYIVKEEETLASIADKFKLKIDKLAVANNIPEKKEIRVADLLKVPQSLKGPDADKSNKENNPKVVILDGLTNLMEPFETIEFPKYYDVYLVKFGDTLQSIAIMCECKEDTLAEVNGLENNHVFKGNDILKIPKLFPETVKQVNPYPYKKKPKKS